MKLSESFILGCFFVLICFIILSTIIISIKEIKEEIRINNLCIDDLGGKMVRGNMFKETKCVIYDNGTIREIPEYLIEITYDNEI